MKVGILLQTLGAAAIIIGVVLSLPIAASAQTGGGGSVKPGHCQGCAKPCWGGMNCPMGACNQAAGDNRECREDCKCHQVTNGCEC